MYLIWYDGSYLIKTFPVKLRDNGYVDVWILYKAERPVCVRLRSKLESSMTFHSVNWKNKYKINSKSNKYTNKKKNRYFELVWTYISLKDKQNVSSGFLLEWQIGNHLRNQDQLKYPKLRYFWRQGATQFWMF